VSQACEFHELDEASRQCRSPGRLEDENQRIPLEVATTWLPERAIAASGWE
jgi:hypothetical protein